MSDNLNTPYERLITTCYELARTHLDPLAHISVDRAGSGFVARVWNGKGGLAKIGPSGQRSKMDAARALKKVLQALGGADPSGAPAEEPEAANEDKHVPSTVVYGGGTFEEEAGENA